MDLALTATAIASALCVGLLGYGIWLCVEEWLRSDAPERRPIEKAPSPEPAKPESVYSRQAIDQT